jgi:hypothetical protein
MRRRAKCRRNCLLEREMIRRIRRYRRRMRKVKRTQIKK